MEFKKVVLLGGGVLGTQIALMCAYTGHDTTIWLRSEGSIGRTQPKLDHFKKEILKALDESKGLIGNPLGAYLYPKALIRDWNSMTAEKIDALHAEVEKNMNEKLHLELDAKKALKDADIVIEAMAENTEEKITFYESIKGILDDKTILCTNSSTLLPSTFAEHTGRPEKYMALHFANSIWAHNTAECMGHEGTDPDIYKQVVQFAKDINMEPIEVHKEQPGYVLNSLLVPLLDAGQNLWARGIADPETIDKAWRIGTGAPVGPFQMMDVIGLQTVSNVLKMKPDAKVPESVTYRLIKMVGEKIEKGELGVAAGKGFYDYTE
ncbi:3-hydroxyacyl-CoA dehydrogenase [Aedoeadaptatus urinae]|uniref:3-hydroxyacyl-CoA dehydrogenase n=1 Tax=Aedoeadaptatus urinae TaxID=1871017 RepID=UPI00097DF609|nr:3-hydroxyacyl-CoA dehydrogenase [Peptoniphilus urinae]